MTNAPATRLDYAARLDRVLAWLTDHLDDELSLERLADVACLSPFHFHRVYHGMRGETVAETVRRLRLHRAAVELIAGELPVPRIARRAGYGSQAAFTRAFKAAYGVPPARYRTVAPLVPVGRERERAMTSHAVPQIEIMETSAIPVAGVPHRGDYQEIGRAFERLYTLAAAEGWLNGPHRIFGVYFDDPSAVAKEQLRSMACLSIPGGARPTGDLHQETIAGGRYGVYVHVGPYAELHRAYDWLFGTWLPSSGYEPDDRPCVEEYLNDPRTLPPTEWRTAIWVPIR